MTVLIAAPMAVAQTRTDTNAGNQPAAATQSTPGGSGANTGGAPSTNNPPGSTAAGANPNGGRGATTGGAMQGSTQSVDVASLRNGLSAERLMDADIYGADDGEIGEVEDVILPQGGSGSPAVIISVGGILGMGERHIAVPIAQLQHNAERDRWTLPGATAESLRALPAVNLNEIRQDRDRRITTAPDASIPGTDSVPGTGGTCATGQSGTATQPVR